MDSFAYFLSATQAERKAILKTARVLVRANISYDIVSAVNLVVSGKDASRRDAR